MNPQPGTTPKPATAPNSPQTLPPAGGFRCLLCGAPMAGGHCKLRCPQCGYIEDCSDLFRADPPTPPGSGRSA